MIKKPAFSMLELIFVIVIMGILAKFGVELLAQSYQNFLHTKINNKLQNQSAMAVDFIAKRLSYRIKDSVIAIEDDNTTFVGIQNINPNKSYRVLEWVQKDIDGWRGAKLPYWSGIADLDPSAVVGGSILTPETNTTAINNLINVLSYGDSTLSDAAIYFIGSNSDIVNGYGWSGAVSGVGASMHPITASSINAFNGNFTGVDISEYYQLAWTANAVSIENDGKGNGTFDLVFYYDYQPWNGQSYTDGKSATIMENVPTFQFRAVGSMIKIQVCVKSDLINNQAGYALCKEKTVF